MSKAYHKANKAYYKANKAFYKANNYTLDSVVILPSFRVNVLKGDNKIMMIKTTDKTR